MRHVRTGCCFYKQPTWAVCRSSWQNAHALCLAQGVCLLAATSMSSPREGLVVVASNGWPYTSQMMGHSLETATGKAQTALPVKERVFLHLIPSLMRHHASGRGRNKNVPTPPLPQNLTRSCGSLCLWLRFYQAGGGGGVTLLWVWISQS